MAALESLLDGAGVGPSLDPVRLYPWWGSLLCKHGKGRVAKMIIFDSVVEAQKLVHGWVI